MVCEIKSKEVCRDCQEVNYMENGRLCKERIKKLAKRSVRNDGC